MLWLAVAALAAAGGAGVAVLLLQRSLDRPMQMPADGLLIEVATGSSLRALASRLADDGVLDSPALLALYGRVTGVAGRIKTGEYEIPHGSTPRALLDILLDGKVKLHAVTLVEGWRVAEAMAAIQAHPAVSSTLAATDPVSIGQMLGMAGSAEGWLFPDTYHFPRGTTDAAIANMAHGRMRDVLEEAWRRRAPNLPVDSAYQALILASIVEKETSLARERTLVAGVFARRITLGMRLQTDPTVIYGLGAEFDGNLRRRDLQNDTPYNTYTRAGLPPTPIALPGEGALMAAVQPDISGALYFVASPAGDGSHVFSRSLAEHNLAVRRYVAASRE